jgi:hypothetical protein
MLYSLRNAWQRAKVSAVFPEPTGLGTTLGYIYPESNRYMNVPSNTNSKPSLLKVPLRIIRQIALRELPGMIQMLMCMPMITTWAMAMTCCATVIVGMADRGLGVVRAA